MTLLAPDSRRRNSDDLTVWIDNTGTRCHVRLRGVLDATTVESFESHVDRVLCFWCDEMVMDLSHLADLDAVGASMLTGFGHYAAARGARFSIMGASPAAARVIAQAESDLSD